MDTLQKHLCIRNNMSSSPLKEYFPPSRQNANQAADAPISLQNLRANRGGQINTSGNPILFSHQRLKKPISIRLRHELKSYQVI